MPCKTSLKNFFFYCKIIFSLLLFITVSSCEKNFDKKTSSVQTTSSDALISQKPNIILIVADDIGYEIPTYNGGESYHTPNLDFMAANGMQFPNFFSHPDGPPSRLALMTGKYNFRNWEKFGYLLSASKTIANMLQDGGYKTCYTGKWQLDGGGASIKRHGFEKYLVFMPFNPDDNNGHDQFYRRYKNPYLYENANWLPANKVKGKYSEDMFFDYASKFIDSNKSKPFFLLYSTNLIQNPWSPTPDNPDFASWDPATDDKKFSHEEYVPGMIAYMDKMIGRLIKKVDDAGLSEQTIILFTSDNATNTYITSRYKGKEVKGGKNSVTRVGINVPLVAYGPGNIAPGVTDTSLVDMTDFLPTLANIAKIPVPSNWGTLDGTTFYDNLVGNPSKQRNSVYCYWPSYGNETPDLPVSFIFDYNFKLYDSTHQNGLFDLRKDVAELHHIPDSRLNANQLKEKEKYRNILSQTMKIGAD